MTVDLPFPEKALWPNGRAHHMAKARAVKTYRHWANVATLAALPACHPALFAGDDQIPVHIAVTAKAGGPLPDRDNCIAAAKAGLDGIAERLGINDRRFAAPTVEFVGRSKIGGFAITIGARG